jgi:UDP-galactopyranose mutase
VTARVPVRTNRDDRYFSDTYQAMPLHGYTRMFEKMLDHPNITVVLNADYRDIMKEVSFREMIYTGPIDLFFDYRYGKLPYRSLEFKFETHDCATYQPTGTVNYPNEHAYTRITEFKYLTGQEHTRTSLVYEFPKAEGDPYYPVPRPENAELYKKYRALAEATPGVHFVGRLATYKYYNMDQVVAQALTTYSKISGLERFAIAASGNGHANLNGNGHAIGTTNGEVKKHSNGNGFGNGNGSHIAHGDMQGEEIVVAASGNGHANGNGHNHGVPHAATTP